MLIAEPALPPSPSPSPGPRALALAQACEGGVQRFPHPPGGTFFYLLHWFGYTVRFVCDVRSWLRGGQCREPPGKHAKSKGVLH